MHSLALACRVSPGLRAAAFDSLTSWGSSRVSLHADLIVCECCDSVFKRRTLKAGEVAACTQCSCVLERGAVLGIDAWLALTVAVAVAGAAASASPVVRVCTQGVCSESTLWQSIASLDQGPAFLAAVIAATIVVAIPAIQIGFLLWMLAFARFGYRAPGFVHGVRILTAVRPWSMVEISIAGALVTMVKLSRYLHVVPLAGAWILLALVPCFVFVSRREFELLWRSTASARPYRAMDDRHEPIA